jgi:dCMP deaminase
MKRSNYIDWDKYFMGVALLSSQRSKDPNTQVGACIVNNKKRIVGIGYNGFPYGCDDEVFPWENDTSFLDSKYPYVVHAEPNAILNANTPLDNCIMYVTLFPCHECSKLIIQSGIKEIIYLTEKYVGMESDVAAKRMLDAAKVTYRNISPFEIIVKDVNND